MTRLLQAMAGAKHGGAEAFFERLAPAFKRAGQEQRVLIRRNAERAARLRLGGVQVEELPFGNWFDLATGPGFKRIVADYRPRIVLTWMNRATRACPRGDFIHVARLGGYYDLKYYRHCDHLVANTRDIVAYLLREGWPKERAHYLPNFVSDMKVPPVSRRSLDTPEGVPLALALGRLHPNKAFDILLAAQAETPDLHLWLAGEGELRGALEAQAAQLGLKERIHFLGWRDDTGALLAAADFLVCPSRHEPLGNVVIEAWAAGIPVIATRSEGPAQLIEDGENGLLVPVDEVAPLAGAMKILIGDPALRAKLSGNGRAAFEAEFSEAHVVALYRNFFRLVAH